MVSAEASHLQPCILLATARFGNSVLIGGQIGFRREADFNLRRRYLAAWTVDRPPALLSNAVENPRPHEPALQVGERDVQSRGAETQSNPSLEGSHENHTNLEVDGFAGVDVRARAISICPSST
jgi:hypothetical protein